MQLLFFHLHNKGVLLWRNEPVRVKTVHTDKLLGGEVGVELTVDAMLMMSSYKQPNCQFHNSGVMFSKKSPGIQTLCCFGHLEAF